MKHYRKRLQSMAAIFARITTGVTFVSAAYIALLWGSDTVLAVDILWQILAVSALCTLGSLLLPCDTEKEVSKKSMLVRNICYFVYVNLAVLGCGFCFEWFNPSNWKMLAAMELCIVAVFAAVMGASYFNDHKTAEQMNRKLGERK